jgi:hypothetical protein
LEARNDYRSHTNCNGTADRLLRQAPAMCLTHQATGLALSYVTQMIDDLMATLISALTTKEKQ